MTTNDQMQIRLHKALPEAESYGLGTMPLINPAETVRIELPDGTTFSGVVTSESAEIDNRVRVVTKTIRVHPEGSMTPHIIRTVDELAALDPDAVVTDGILTVAAGLAALYAQIGILGIPAVVVATGDQARAARQALGEASTGGFHSSIGLWQQQPATWEEE